MTWEVTAVLKYATTSYKKMELIAKIVRWKRVFEALTLLEYLPKKAGQILHRLIKSAAANAVENAWYNLNDLVIDTIYVGRGPKIKRMRFASRSKTHRYIKHRSFVKVILVSQ
jgi:large subunit ribosomal protein L22